MSTDYWSDQTQTSAATTTQPTYSRTRTTQEVLSEAGALRTRVRLLEDDTKDLALQVASSQHEAFEAELDRRTGFEAKRGVPEMLSDVADLGFAWRDVARLIGVSVPAVRKWRQGEPATGPNRRAIARLLAFVRMLESDHHVVDVPSWLEVPLAAEAPVTGLDLYAAQALHLLYDRAAMNITDEQALDQFEPGWRSLYSSSVEVFVAEDGESGIRIKGT